MKKLFTLLLAIAGMVSTASATDVTIYFQPNSDWKGSGATFKLYGYVNSGDENAGSVIDMESFYDYGNGIYSATMDISSYPYIRFGRYDSSGNTWWNKTNTAFNPTTDTYYYMTGSNYGDWNTYPCTATTYFPWKYYFMSNKSGSWKADAVMTEANGVYSYTFPASTYADKKFAIAKGDAFNSDGSFPDGTNYDNWKKAIRPTATSAQFNVKFQDYSSDTETDRNDASAAVWYVEPAHNFGTIELNFTPGSGSSGSYTINCEHSVGITSVRYATYSNAYQYKVKDATAYIINTVGETATLSSLGESADIPAGTGIIISGNSGTYTVVPSSVGSLPDVSGNKLIGSNSYNYQITGWDGSINYTGYILSYQESYDGLGFYKAETNSYLNPNKAFLKIPSTKAQGDVRQIRFSFDESTGINEAQNSEAQNSAIYNLQGVRMNKLQKGLNILNGKKVMVK